MYYPDFVANEQFFSLHDAIPLEQQCQALADDIKRIHSLSAQHYDSFEALIDQYLQAGLDIFDMETGIVSQINTESCIYTVEAVNSPLDVLSTGDAFELQDTYCREVVQTKQVIGFPKVGEHPDMCLHPVYQNLKLEAYLSAPIWLEGELYGTLNFTSRQARDFGFSEHERDLVALMALSIGNFLMLQKKEQALQAANERLKMFVGYVSHDLRNPLGVIKNMSAMGIKHSPETGRVKNIFERIEGNSDMALELVSSILDIAALGTGKIELSRQQENLSELVHDCLTQVAPVADLQQLKFCCDISADTMIWADSVRLHQVLVNLLNNSCKYSPEQSEIHINADAEAGSIRVTVENSIAPEFNADAEAMLPSTGFGLQIVREVLQAHGSELETRIDEDTFIAEFLLPTSKSH